MVGEGYFVLTLIIELVVCPPLSGDIRFSGMSLPALSLGLSLSSLPLMVLATWNPLLPQIGLVMRFLGLAVRLGYVVVRQLGLARFKGEWNDLQVEDINKYGRIKELGQEEDGEEDGLLI